MPTIYFELPLGSFPRVADPWPETVGWDLPFTLAGAGAMLAGVFFTGSPDVRRDRAIRLGGAVGFLAGTGFYLIALVVQVGFY